MAYTIEFDQRSAAFHVELALRNRLTREPISVDGVRHILLIENGGPDDCCDDRWWWRGCCFEASTRNGMITTLAPNVVVVDIPDVIAAGLFIDRRQSSRFRLSAASTVPALRCPVVLAFGTISFGGLPCA